MSIGSKMKKGGTDERLEATTNSRGSTSPSSPLLRSASDKQLISSIHQYELPVRTDSIRRSFSQDVLPVEHALPFDFQFEHQEPASVADTDVKTPRSKIRSSFDGPVFAIGPDETNEQGDAGHLSKGIENASLPPARPRRSVSGSIAKFRRSWVAPVPSVAPSVHKRRSIVEPKDKEGGTGQPLSKLESPYTDSRPSEDGPQRRPSLLRRKSRQSLNALTRRKSMVDEVPLPALPNTYPTENLPTLKHKPSNLSDATSTPSTNSHDRLHGIVPEISRRKDELWGAFRNLENEFYKFQTRPSTTKVAQVRNALLPFLRTYADHPSNSTLRPEDLDRRTTILNKWWTGLLEMLNGRNGESVSGNDRPAVLEAASAIMIRPEWVSSPTATTRRPGKTLLSSSRTKSNTSLGSNMSDFLIDSVLHNVKNTFSHNLLSQMAYVVQKMSSRSVPASVVAFSGKATAYAFFYCEGVAAILVRLWRLKIDLLRQVVAVYGLSPLDNIGSDGGWCSSQYPTCLHPLAFRSVASAARYLRARPQLPLAFSSIPWHGPWVSRWAGKDTDLFFVFMKNYTDLSCRHMPDDMDTQQQLSVPAWLLVQAQLLNVVFGTINRYQEPHATEKVSLNSSGFVDDAQSEANVNAALLPLSTTGLPRSMAENRLVMLLRDSLGSTQVMADSTQVFFAGAFTRLLGAAIRRISLFNHLACFTLCDFLEEAIAILSRFNKASGVTGPTFDWKLLREVCEKMLQSQNTITQVRTFAFIYSMWSNILPHAELRRSICIEWLISAPFFHHYFAHWCPMVRAYFMRLLIWKVSRPSKGVLNSDRETIEALRDRLKETWQSYENIVVDCDKGGLLRPSTAPCNPAPGRQLLILRDDIQAATSGMFLSFEGILAPAESKNLNSETDGLMSSTKDESRKAMGAADVKEDDSGVFNKKKWGVFRSFLPFSDRHQTNPKTSFERPVAPKPNGRLEPLDAKAPTSDSKSPGPGLWNNVSQRQPTPAFRSLSFKFSLEWVEKSNPHTDSDRPLPPPTLPPLAASFLGAHTPKPTQPQISDSNSTTRISPFRTPPDKNVGRALAEWTLLVAECEHFFDRRIAEGVPSLEFVETPLLSVDAFRRP